jgi:glutamine synthetase
MAALCTAAANGYARFRAERAGAAGAVSGAGTTAARCCAWWDGAATPATRIGDRLGEPAAKTRTLLPGLADRGRAGRHSPRPAPRRPRRKTLHPGSRRLPASLGAALDALARTRRWWRGWARRAVAWYTRLERQEARRFEDAPDKDVFQRSELFSRF